MNNGIRVPWIGSVRPAGEPFRPLSPRKPRLIRRAETTRAFLRARACVSPLIKTGVRSAPSDKNLSTTQHKAPGESNDDVGNGMRPGDSRNIVGSAISRNSARNLEVYTRVIMTIPDITKGPGKNGMDGYPAEFRDSTAYQDCLNYNQRYLRSLDSYECGKYAMLHLIIILIAVIRFDPVFL